MFLIALIEMEIPAAAGLKWKAGPKSRRSKNLDAPKKIIAFYFSSFDKSYIQGKSPRFREE